MNHNKQQHFPSCHNKSNRFDYLLWVCLILVTLFYFTHLIFNTDIEQIRWISVLTRSIYELINTIWWGIAIGILMIAVLGKIPREYVISILGTNKGLSGIFRATAAGILLDLCSHGILMVGAKFYERGARIGQVIAFLVASPWNSFSLTLILISLIGLSWTLAFIGLSMFIAIIVGLLFDLLAKQGVLPINPQQVRLPHDFQFWSAARAGLKSTTFSVVFFKDMLWNGLIESRMVMRWILFGVLLASLVRAFIPNDQFETYFGPTLLGLSMTVGIATILEVCSEGSTPIAADILTRANAPGNSFAFLMTGVSTDYTEIMILKDATKSWKIALFLPLLTLPQVILIAWLINQVSF